MRLFFLIIFTFAGPLFAEIKYEKPKAKELITHIPQTMTDSWKMSFNTNEKTLWTWAGIVSSTTVFYIYDEQIVAEFQRFGRKLGLGNDDHTRDMVRIGSINIFRGPTDWGSALYFLGDGWTHFAIGSSFLAAGSIGNNNRALQTGAQIYHGMITSTIANQALKRSFGRESPVRKSRPRGDWRPFPSFTTYNKDISKYDAMPTGHLMTATMTFTIIDQNYPEAHAWFRPFGLTWLTLLGYQMVNNGVHWISDYPLGIAMGYVFGKVSSQYGKIKDESSTEKKISDLSNWDIYPLMYRNKNNSSFGLISSIHF